MSAAGGCPPRHGGRRPAIHDFLESFGGAIQTTAVMAGLVPAIHATQALIQMAGTRSAMTAGVWIAASFARHAGKVLASPPVGIARRAACAAIVLAACLLALLPPSASAATPEFELHIKNQAFAPDTLAIPSGETVKIVVHNDDAMPAEFESSDVNREKVVPGGTAVPVYVGPLKPGTYKFFNDFHPASTGKLVVAPAAPNAK